LAVQVALVVLEALITVAVAVAEAVAEEQPSVDLTIAVETS
jgi:hypothetical protein